MVPCSERSRSSQSLKRGQQPAQCTVVPPTALQVQVGRLGKSFVIRHDPEVVRLSSQASCAKEGHSSSMKSSGPWCAPASSSTTGTPAWHSSLASVPPPAPEPMMTTTSASSWA
jgi:hypothetical protein